MGRALAANGRYARASRKDLKTPKAELERLHAELGEALIAEYIERTLQRFPPLTNEQRTRLATLLNP
jgi:hypothetical protein